jgi:multicomponent Na+:H+ antiporter subunit A
LKLALWHGWNVAVLCSMVSVSLGVMLYLRREALLATLERMDLGRLGPARWYEAALEGMLRLARLQTRLLQAGYLRVYVLVVFTIVLATVGYSLLRHGWPGMPALTGVRFHEAFIVVLILAAALAAVRSTSRLAAIAALGVVGYGVGVLFAIFGAPDLAITQLIVETLLVLLFVFAFYRMPRFSAQSRRGSRIRDAAVALGVGALMTALTLVAAAVRLHPPVSDHYGEVSVLEAHGRNVVNVILVDFRAMDTLGEIVVVAVAAVGVLALLRLRRGRSTA